MICLKGCSKEIEMLNELLSTARLELNEEREAGVRLIGQMTNIAGALKEKQDQCEDLTQANLRAATAFKNCETDKLVLEARVKELESRLLNFTQEGTPRKTYLYTTPLKPEEEKIKREESRKLGPIIEKIKQIDSKREKELFCHKGQCIVSKCPDTCKGDAHFILVYPENYGIHYNEPVTGQPLFSPDFVGEIPSTSKYPAKKKK